MNGLALVIVGYGVTSKDRSTDWCQQYCRIASAAKNVQLIGTLTPNEVIV